MPTTAGDPPRAHRVIKLAQRAGPAGIRRPTKPRVTQTLDHRSCARIRRSILRPKHEWRPFIRSTIRRFRPGKASGLTVPDVPPDVTAALGVLRQLRVHAIVNGKEFASTTMPAGGGKLALSLSKAILKECGLTVGDEAEFVIQRLT
jgi:hypothetical protein